MPDPTFAEWLSALDALAAKCGVVGRPYSEQTGEECWREMFDDGLTPEEAWGEECASGGDDA